MAVELTPDEAVALIRTKDTVATGLATGQPQGLLETLGRRDDFEDLELYAGLFTAPYAVLSKPGVRVFSGFFGPIERMLREANASLEYLPADFIGLEQLADRLRPRVVLAATTLPDADGYLSFGVHAGASFRAFQAAARDPARVAIAEANPNMPRVGGFEQFGGHRIHVSEIDALVVHETDLFAIAPAEPSDVERSIAAHAAALIEPGSTLQFGIGNVPNEIARLLAERAAGDLSVHSEMISDGVMALHKAGRIVNRKPIYGGFTVATFALGSAGFYEWLDENPEVRLVPVSNVNDVALLRKLPRFVSVNAALAIDLRGQVVADHIGGRQHSGIGGHETFVMGATECPDGKSLLCLASTAIIGGKVISKIIPRVPEDATVTTPRQHVQYVVTEHGVVDLSVLGDRSRAAALIEIAAPQFRDWLRAEARHASS